MNQQVQAFLDSEKEKALRRRQEHLIDLGFYEKVYAPDDQSGEEYPFFDWDSDKPRYYKKVVVDVTEEEYREILKYTAEPEADRNAVATILAVIAWIIFIAGFIAGLGLVYDTFAITLLCWLGSFISGMTFLGLSEIIKLLHAIKRK